VLASPPPIAPEAEPAAAVTDVSGRWDVQIAYAASSSTHALSLRQRGSVLEGWHRGDFIPRDVTGSIDGSAVRIRSAFGEETGDAIALTFTGTVSGDEMSGSLDMGEYLAATWTARRRRGPRG
jgi:L-seryl-tRNA(Ser) seleniumtransferase